MKFLLTDSGVRNASIRQALVDLLGEPITETDAGIQVVSEGQWIAVTGADVSTSAGRLLLTTVGVTEVTDVAEAVGTWFDDRKALVPREALVPAGQSDEQVQKVNQESFTKSESTAITVALTEMGQPAGVRVSIDVREIGGPSAGLMLARIATAGDALRTLRTVTAGGAPTPC